MLNKKLKGAADSKLTKALNQITDNIPTEKTGFINETTNKTLFKTKSFRLRKTDLNNLKSIITKINETEERRKYSDSQILRGLINYFSDNIEKDYGKIIAYIKVSS